MKKQVFLWCFLLLCCEGILWEGCQVSVNNTSFENRNGEFGFEKLKGDSLETERKELKEPPLKEKIRVQDAAELQSENTTESQSENMAEVLTSESFREKVQQPDVVNPSKLGGPCKSNSDCGGGSNYCILDQAQPQPPPYIPFPFLVGPRGGYCSSQCDRNTRSCPKNGFCYIPGDSSGGCLQKCTTRADCRRGQGYRCDLLGERTIGGSSKVKVCLPLHDRCHYAKYLNLVGGKVTIKDDTRAAVDEHPTLKCKSNQVTGGGLKKGQLYYRFIARGGKRYQFTLTPKAFYAFLYIFEQKNNCQLSKIEQDCGSGGKTGLISKIANPGKTLTFSFQTVGDRSIVFAVDSDRGAGLFELQIVAQ